MVEVIVGYPVHLDCGLRTRTRTSMDCLRVVHNIPSHGQDCIYLRKDRLCFTVNTSYRASIFLEHEPLHAQS